jgi:hypothetical protein
MIIINQDKDQQINLSTKDIVSASHKSNGIFMGWNLYGKMLLGTFDTSENCEAVKEQMRQCERLGFYIVPEEMDEDDSMYDSYNRLSIWINTEFIVDYTATPRKPDPRIVEPFGTAG